MAKKKRKIRVAFRKNRQKRARAGEWQQQVESQELDEVEAPGSERISGKGELTRYRTVIEEPPADVQPDGDVRARTEREIAAALAVDEAECLRGRVVSVHGPACEVEGQDGRTYRCTVRRLLKTLAIETRSAVVAGDRVLFRVVRGDDGRVERIEPRRGVLARAVRGHEHIIAANVDQTLIVASAAQPPLKPNLIDRYLASAEKGELEPLVVINKCDLVDRAALMPIAGLYSQLGYRTIIASAATGFGIDELRHALRNRETVLSGQSGVGKSSLLNALQPGLGLRVAEVSRETTKGKHTTTAAQLLRLDIGGWVVDTPGVRQFELWDVIPEEVEGYFVEFRPLVPHCRFPDCTHTHEQGCAVKRALDLGLIAEQRYESYLRMFQGEAA